MTYYAYYSAHKVILYQRFKFKLSLFKKFGVSNSQSLRIGSTNVINWIVYSRVKESNHHCFVSKKLRLYIYKLVRTALTFSVPKKKPKILSSPLNPITEISLDSKDPKNFKIKKENKKKKKKEEALTISFVSR